jgi:hypothetical protein
MLFARSRLIAAVAAVLLATACGDEGAESPVSPTVLPSLTVQDLITSASAAGIAATARSGVPPVPNGGPSVTVSGNGTIVNGGTLVAGVTGAAAFQTLYLAVGGETVGVATSVAGGVSGFYELRLPATLSDLSVLLEFAQSIPLRQLELLFAVADASGRVGPYSRLETTVASVGTGDVQVTLSWDADSDVDLHVIDPAGEEVYYAHRQSASGGQLDLDSNAGCTIDGVRNENITWPVGRAPRGSYTVRVDYWSSCSVSQTNYTVRVNNGGSVQVFSGSFSGPGDQGGAGSGRPITVFERLTGPTAGPPSTPSGVGPSGYRSKTLVVVPR